MTSSHGVAVGSWYDELRDVIIGWSQGGALSTLGSTVVYFAAVGTGHAMAGEQRIPISVAGFS